jgi:membrane protease YdiL (CAAX protease family)
MAEGDRARLLPLLPGTPREKAFYALLAIAAGIGEELVYRGTMFALCEHLTGSAWAAAILAAASFAVGHAVQGAVTATLVGAVALAFQGLAAATGALYAGMSVHALFDLVVGLFARQLLGSAATVAPPEPPLANHGDHQVSGDKQQLPARGGSGNGGSTL